MIAQKMDKPIETKVEWLTKLSGTDLEDLCRAAEQAINDGNGFGWLKPPPRDVLENYWRGTLMVPGREVIVARYDGTIVGSAQLTRPPSNNEAQSFAAAITTFFIAPFARGHGLARGLLTALEARAGEEGFEAIELNVRQTQTAAIALYESCGYQRWARKDRYAKVEGEFVGGYFYAKALASADGPGT
jgi:ribosomal protein S18 acetylase RimI-like enzyme